MSALAKTQEGCHGGLALINRHRDHRDVESLQGLVNLVWIDIEPAPRHHHAGFHIGNCRHESSRGPIEDIRPQVGIILVPQDRNDN